MLAPDLRGNSRDVVVADECLWGEGIEEMVVTIEAPLQLKEISIRDTRPDCLPQFVLGQ